jgi:hypothetical protein
VLAFSHGDHGSHGAGHGFGFSHAHSGGHPHTANTHSNFGQQVNQQGIAGQDADAVLEAQAKECGCQPDETEAEAQTAQTAAEGDLTRTFLVHVTNHGHVEAMKRFYALAREFDLIRLDDRRPNFDTVNEVRYELADWNAWAKPYNDGDMPDGFVPGFTGTTTFYKQAWQVGKRKHWWSLPAWDSKAATFIEVAYVVWHYHDTADYETKLTLRVVSFPAFDHTDGRWGIRKKAFFRHQAAARKLAERIFEMLKGIPSSKQSQILRQYYLSRLPQPPAQPRGDGTAVADPKEEQALEQAEVLREKAHDAETRADAGQNKGASGDTPADNSSADLAQGIVAKDVRRPVESAEHAASGVDLGNIIELDMDPVQASRPTGASLGSGKNRVTVEFPIEE